MYSKYAINICQIKWHIEISDDIKLGGIANTLNWGLLVYIFLLFLTVHILHFTSHFLRESETYYFSEKVIYMIISICYYVFHLR